MEMPLNDGEIRIMKALIDGSKLTQDQIADRVNDGGADYSHISMRTLLYRLRIRGYVHSNHPEMRRVPYTYDLTDDGVKALSQITSGR